MQARVVVEFGYSSNARWVAGAGVDGWDGPTRARLSDVAALPARLVAAPHGVRS